MSLYNNKHLEVGKIGEGLAKNYLEKQGYKIIEQNYKTKYAEIDLIAQNKNELIFVEVRTKVGENFGSPEETINNKKKKKLLGNASTYAAIKKWEGIYKIDAICIVLKSDYSIDRLNHHKNIFS